MCIVELWWEQALLLSLKSLSLSLSLSLYFKSNFEMIFKPGRLCALWSLGGGELYLWGMKLSHKLRAGILFKLLLHRNQHCAMNDTIYLEGFLSKDEGQGLRIKNQGSRIKNQGSRIKDQHNIVHLVISNIYQPSNLFVFSSSTA